MTMAKLAVIVLLGLLALAAAVDVETQTKKHSKHYDDGHDDDHHGDHHSYVEVKHGEWEWEEKVGKTHPCAEEYEILGSTVAQDATLLDDDKEVGHVYWSGIVVKHELCKHCKDYKSKSHHDVKVNYEVIFDVEGKGQIIGKVVAGSIFSDDTVTIAVLGGTGHFVGASGTITWTSGKKSTYKFDIYLPKVHKHDDDKYGGKDDGKHGKHDDKYDDDKSYGKHDDDKSYKSPDKY